MVEYQEMKDNSDWYYANLDALLPKYNGQYVAIADKGVFGAFAECIDGVRALEKAGKQKGTFIVRRCVPLEEEKREWYYRTGRIRRGAMVV